MKFFKQNPALCSFCLGALLVFAGLSALLVFESNKLSESKERVTGLEVRLKALLYAKPSPTAENLAAAKRNLDELNAKLLNICQSLQSGPPLTTSTDPARVVSGIQKYIINYQRRAKDHKNIHDFPAPIRMPEDCAFGFEKYLDASILPEGLVVSKLDKQRQVLGYVLDQLIASDPFSIRSVEREVFEGGTMSENGFRIDPKVSAREPGIIDTFAFQLTFTGYTSTLRRFLNSLTEVQLPVVIREVEVDRSKTDLKNEFDALFSATKSIQSEQRPVVAETESIFTVTLEYIEVISTLSPKDETS